jgi:hypothetical protein
MTCRTSRCRSACSRRRAAINVVELPYDGRDPLAAHVRVEVALPGETEEVI